MSENSISYTHKYLLSLHGYSFIVSIANQRSFHQAEELIFILLARGAVVGKEVRGTLAKTADGVAGGEVDDPLAHRGGRPVAFENHQVGGDTGDVRSSHASTGNSPGVAVAADPGRLDLDTGCEDVDTGAVVGEAGAAVEEVGGTDGADGRLGGGRNTLHRLVLVTGGNGQEKTGADGSCGSVVKGALAGATEREVGDGALALGVTGSPTNTIDDRRSSTVSIAVQDLHADELSVLGYTEDGTANSTSNMSAWEGTSAKL